MITLILGILLGGLFAYLAFQNTMGVTVRAGNYLFSDIPLFLIASASLLFGIFIAWVLSLGDWISTSATIHGKESELRSTEHALQDAEKRIESLEHENTKLHEEVEKLKSTPAELRNRSFIDKFRHGVSF
mgnify:CR=1 FL=1